MQKPPAQRAALAVHPHQNVVGCAGDEVVARDVAAVPPARLDALGPGEEPQGSAAVRRGADLLERLRRRQQPERSQGERARIGCAGADLARS